MINVSHIGFTGTQHGMTEEQKETFRRLMIQFSEDREIVFHHGDCIGADAEAHDIATEFGEIEIHPPINTYKRAFKDAKIQRIPREYLDRNHDIVDSSDFLIACPKEYEEVMRSGTWATIRYAKKHGQKVYLIQPDGKFEE